MHVGGVWGALEDEWLQGSWQQQPAGSAPGPQGAEAEICFSVCSGSGRMVKREKGQSSWGQRRPPPLPSSQQIDGSKCHAFSLPTCYCPFGTRARVHTHTHTEDTLRGQAVSCFHPAVGRHVTDPNGISY